MNDNQSAETDWASQIVGGIESFVTTVKSKTTEPVQKVARYAVFALMGISVVFMAILLFVIFLVRLFGSYFPVWSVYLVLGGIFLLFGGLLWRKGRRPSKS